MDVLILHIFIVFVHSQGEGVPLLLGEKKEIEELLPAGTSDEDKETIFGILGQAMCRPAGIQVMEFTVCTNDYRLVVFKLVTLHSMKTQNIDNLFQ